MSAYASVDKAYTETSVLTAPPGRLVVMLYDGGIRFLLQSAAAMRAGEMGRARDRMRRAEAVIDELNLSLDMKYGELSKSLRSIYLFCKRLLREANGNREPARIDAAVRLLTDLREAWEQVIAKAERAST